jgi:tetratricopeptide (TPR) repeat protein
MKPVAAPAVAEVKSTPLVLQLRQSLEKGLILERGGAWALYQQLVSQAPKDPQRSAIEIDLASALEEIGQQAINNYVNAPISGLTPDTFHRGAVAYNNLKQLSRTTSTQLEAKRLFCEGRALIVEGRKKEAIQMLEQAVALDPKAAYSYNALGVAYEGEKKEEKASDSFRRAADLAPNWELPRIHIGILYYNKDKFDKAEEHFKRAKEIDPRDSLARVMLIRTLRGLRQFDDAEREGLELIQLMPRYAQGYIEIGIIYEASKQYSRAADAFETYLRLDPNSKDAAAVRERIDANRRTGGGKKPSLKKK